MFKVLPINSFEVEPWLLQKHYAKRMCPISYAFGLYYQEKLIGIVTYGIPSSSSLRMGICGCDYIENVMELNRLCCENQPNMASMLVGRSLQMLPKPLIVVSYADTKQGHVGYVYQATNFIYTGLSAKRTDWKIKGMEHLHGATIADLSRGQENRANWMREKFGDDFYLENRSRKHRYIFLLGNKNEKKAMSKALKYKVKPYPKGESKRYDAGGKVQTQQLLFA
tara:strand:+ start:78 stop:749 length:672 start_codon:yes stop_codon:yes gene_type:complete